MVIEIKIDELERARRKAERREKLQRKVNDAKNWAEQNKELIMFAAPSVIGVVTAAVKAADKHIKIKQEKDVKDLYCYDRSLGHYWRLRRELSNKEWTEIDRRKRNGERMADILRELNVLK